MYVFRLDGVGSVPMYTNELKLVLQVIEHELKAMSDLPVHNNKVVEIRVQMEAMTEAEFNSLPELEEIAAR
jgi:hypothetical protein